MSTNVEDLYLKGFMAFSAKNYDSAKAYWQNVLALDPSHEKARKGLEDLKKRAAGGGKKKSSKEIFKEIKRLYSEKNYAEALKLCELLLKKHPNNTDLQGLRKKLVARVQGGEKPKAQAPPPEAKSTMIIAGAAESSVEDQSAKVEALIQDGVSRYEVQNYEEAIASWKKALELDPENRIARDYIDNVSSLLQEDEAPAPEPEPVPAPVAEPEPQADARPSKEEMMNLYNGAMESYKLGNYEDALGKWRRILKFHPNHKETLQCVERTEAQIKAQEDAAKQVNEASVDSGLDLGIVEGNEEKLELDVVQTESATSAPQEVIVPDKPVEEAHVSHSASDDQLSDFFDENQKTATHGLRQVSKVVKPKRQAKPMNKKLVFGLPAILIVLGVGGYFGYDYYNRILRAPDAQPRMVREIFWNSAQQQSVDFLQFGADFADNDDAMLAFVAYERSLEVGEPRLSELELLTTPTPDDLEEVTRIKRTIDRARREQGVVEKRIEVKQVSDRDLERAQGEMDREMYQEAIDRLRGLLSNDISNAHLRDQLGAAYEKLAFRNIADGDKNAAFEDFKKATVLLSGNDRVRHHTESINRFFQGKITDVELEQWFFFFIN